MWTKPPPLQRAGRFEGRDQSRESGGPGASSGLQKGRDGGGKGKSCQQQASPQETRSAALSMLSGLHPVAACHVIAALCNQLGSALDHAGKGVGWGNGVQNSILCLRALDACVLMLRKVCFWLSSRHACQLHVCGRAVTTDMRA